MYYIAQQNSGSNSIGIIIPAVLGSLLVLALILIAVLAVFACKRRKRNKPPSIDTSVLYTNNGINPMDNPVYMGVDTLVNSTNGSVASDLHFDPRTHGDAEGDGRYATVDDIRDNPVFVNNFADSTEDLIGPPQYATIRH